MTNIANTYNLEGVYIGPAPATGAHFFVDSGYPTYIENSNVSGPILAWPEAGIREYTFSNLTNIQTGIEFNGYKNVLRISPNTTNNLHDLRISPLFLSSAPIFTGLLYTECDFYVPSSNTDVKRVFFIKNNNTSSDGDIPTVTGNDIWIKYKSTRLVDFKGLPTEYLGMRLTTGAWGTSTTTSTQIYVGNPNDVCYVKDFKAIILSGYNYINLVQPLERVQSVNYSINVPRQSLTQVGQKNNIAITPIEAPTVNLDITTIQNILSNENKIGFNVNFSNFLSGNNGNSIYNGFNYDILNRFTSRSYTGVSGVLYPLQYADKRNIFVSISQEKNDRKIESNNLNNPTYGFGNCYLSNYSWSISNDQLPIVKYGYICENAEFYKGSYGRLPSLISRNATNPTGRGFIIPNYSGSNNNIAAALPIDTVITINNTGYGGVINSENIGVRISDFKIQGASFELNLERRNLDSVGFQLPVNRKINYPVFVNLSVDAIVGNEYIGSINNIFKSDSPYDINIKLNNKCSQTGVESYKNTLVQYDFKSAYLNNISYNSQVGGFKTVNFNFIQEMNPENGIGLFMSGLVYGRTLQTTGTTNNLCFRPIEFIHRSGNLTYYNSII